jgi:putative DNA primase/helicase
LRAAFPQPAQKERPKTEQPRKVSKHAGDESSLKPQLRELVINGPADESADRSSYFMSAVAQLKHAGWPLESIVALLEKYPNGIASKYAASGRIATEAERCYSKVNAEKASLPFIDIIPGTQNETIAEIEQALIRKGTPIFARFNRLVLPIERTVDGARGSKTTVWQFTDLDQESMKIEMGNAANFQRYRMVDGQPVPYTVDPPSEYARLVLANKARWAFPEVIGIAMTPTLRRDGSLLTGDRPHYDPATRLYYASDVTMPPIPDRPTMDDARKALELLAGLFSETPFVGKVDRAVALSALLTALVRGSLDTAPLHFFRAHTAGTGKSYLADVISSIVLGKPAPIIAVPESEEEFEKRLASAALAGTPLLSLDNATHDIGGAFLNQLSERSAVQPRILGRSKIPECDCRMMLFATANNQAVYGDMTRRTLMCNLDAGVEQPELREFKGDPLREVLADRGKYIAAGLTVIRAYLTAGEPRVCKPLGSYREWTRMVRSPLVWLGMTDPVDSMKVARRDDPVLTTIREFFALANLQPGQFYRVRDIVGRAALEGYEDLRDLLIRVSEGGDKINSLKVGTWLKSICGRIVDGTRLQSDHSVKATARYYVEPA